MPQGRNEQGRSVIRRAIRTAGLIGALLALTGCVVVPAYYPRYAYRPYHPYRYHYYYYP
jgi:hypothetical protein